MTVAGWTYHFFEATGEGYDTFVRGNVPMANVQATKVLSGPHQITGDLLVPLRDLQAADGSPLIKRWKTTVYVEDPNEEIWVGGIVADYDIDGPKLSLDVTGFVTQIKEQPFDAEITGAIAVDPMSIVRQVWEHHQSRPGGDLGLVLESIDTPVRIGTPETNSASTAEGENIGFTETSGPVRLNWWSTDDSGGVIDRLAAETPFDYLEEHYWVGSQVHHRLRFGYPSIGEPKPHLRFVLGENVFHTPTEDYTGEDVVTEVWVLGAGEGRARIRGMAASHPTSSVRRVKIVDDKKISSNAEATARAREILMAYQPNIPGAGMTTLVVRNHSNAPLGTYDVGDQVIYSGDHEWGDVVIWVKIVKMTVSPDSSDDVTLSVVRTDTLV